MCTSTEPTKVWNATAVCGNGQVEEGEACDCGGWLCPNDPCCNGVTCQLLDGNHPLNLIHVSVLPLQLFTDYLSSLFITSHR
jgi:hypothetical protein